MVNLKLLMIILDENNDKKVGNLLNKMGIKVKIVTSAIGTASPSVLDYFGLVEAHKNIFMALIPDYAGSKILSKLKSVFDLGKEGTGIVFTIPLSSSNKFLQDAYSKNVKEGKSVMSKEEKKAKYHLVVTIISEGYLENIMAAAKKAGCSGGTVIKARDLGNIIPTKILGFNVGMERELVLNIVEENNRKKVMEEISSAVGIKTKGKGICFSVPVDDTIGLDIHA